MPPLFFFNDAATTEIYTLSLHDALPISPEWTSAARGPRRPPRRRPRSSSSTSAPGARTPAATRAAPRSGRMRSEEHTSELQSRQYLVCRLLLEKKKIHTSVQLRELVSVT